MTHWVSERLASGTVRESWRCGWTGLPCQCYPAKMLERAEAGEATLTLVNQRFYDQIWRDAVLYQGEDFNSWEVVGPLAARSADRLEVGPGLRPRLPVGGTQFVDLSPVAVERLNQAGGNAVEGSIDQLPFERASVDLVAAFDVLEHVRDDHAALAELTRVLRPGGTLFLSVPLYKAAWTGFDELVGHARRYEPDDVEALLAAFGLDIFRSAAFGMQPASKILTNVAVWFLKRQPERALRFYNKHLFPRAMKQQSSLVFQRGLLRDPNVDEVMLECRLR